MAISLYEFVIIVFVIMTSLGTSSAVSIGDKDKKGTIKPTGISSLVTPVTGATRSWSSHQQQHGASVNRKQRVDRESDMAETAFYNDYYGDRMTGADWIDMTASRHHHQYHRRCVSIPTDMALCRGLNYTEMRLPNELGHNSIDEAKEQSNSWIPLANVRCHPDTRLFLCSLFAPICLGDSSAPPILPCRSLCQAVRSGCERKMMSYNFTWPDMLNCDRYPPDNDMCIEPQHRLSKPADGGSTCNLCKKQPETVESIIDQYCSAEFVVRVQIMTNTTVYKDGRLLVTSRKKVYKGNLTKVELRHGPFIVEQVSACRCEIIKRYTPNRRYVIMGSRGRGGRLSVTFLMPMGGKSINLDHALRAIRKSSNICSGGPAAIRTAGGKQQNKKADKKTKKQKQKQRDKSAESKKKNDKKKTQSSRPPSNSKSTDSRSKYVTNSTVASKQQRPKTA